MWILRLKGLMMCVICLSCVSASLALQHGSFVPCKRLAAKDLLTLIHFF